MKLRFAVDQAESFRRGVNAPKSVAVIEVNPSGLPEKTRNLIADHLFGIDVCKYAAVPEGETHPPHIKAMLPTLESLVGALDEYRKDFPKSPNIQPIEVSYKND